MHIPDYFRPPVFQYKEKFNAEVVQDGSDFLPRATFSLSQATRSAFSTNRTILLVLFHLSRCLLEEEANKKHAKIMTPSTNQCLLWACLTSKAFCNAGLDILWANQSSVYPALKILPCVSLSDSGFYVGSFDIVGQVLIIITTFPRFYVVQYPEKTGFVLIFIPEGLGNSCWINLKMLRLKMSTSSLLESTQRRCFPR